MLDVGYNSEAGDDLEEDVAPEKKQTLVGYLAKAGLINGFGMSMEYMITHVGIIVVNPMRYRLLTAFTENYLVSPLGLIGRGAIWMGRGLLAVAVPGERPESFEQVVKKSGIDLLALATVNVLYHAASKQAGHPNLLIEEALVDTVVTSMASSLIELAVEKAPSIRWQFWRSTSGQSGNGNDDQGASLLYGTGYNPGKLSAS
ncbi:MAG: hypothetical protein V4501_11700 [Pseudomonadota bacterium]